jgi:ABC-type transporter MlaC component
MFEEHRHRYSEDLPIDYWLHNVNGQWKVFNMVIDHVVISSRMFRLNLNV